MSVSGYVRGTDDLDFAISLAGMPARRLADILGGHYVSGGQTDPLRGVIKVSIPSGAGPSIQVDLVIFPVRWNQVLFESLQLVRIGELTIPTVPWHALILTKVYAGGPQDILDAVELARIRSPREDELLGIARAAKDLRIGRDFARFAKRIASGETLRKIESATRGSSSRS